MEEVTPKAPSSDGNISAEDCELILLWIKEGEDMMTKYGDSMFRLGMWWADRPWRKK